MYVYVYGVCVCLCVYVCVCVCVCVRAYVPVRTLPVSDRMELMTIIMRD